MRASAKDAKNVNGSAWTASAKFEERPLRGLCPLPPEKKSR
jgi:hypothetical protein